jgi:7-cyano-7-deazaguanine synthase
MKNAIILCSGGLDSVVTAYYIKKRLGYDKIKFLFFDYGQRALKQEKKASRFFCDKLKSEFIEVKLNWLGEISESLINSEKRIKKVSREDLKDSKKEGDKYYVPFRNGIFLSHAIAFADSLFFKNKKKEVWDIFVGFKCEGRESFPDTTREFVEAVNKLMKVSKIHGKVVAPLIEKDKEDIVLLGKELGVELNKTYSCYVGVKGSGRHCGVCLACKLRQEGFYWANVRDGSEYVEKRDIL